MKKIVHIITRMDKGGSAENVVISCRHIDGSKYESLLVHGLSGVPAPEGIKSIPVPELVRNISPLADLRAFFRLVKLLRELRPDLVHTHSSKAGFIGRWAARFAGVRTIVHTPHGHVFYGYGFGPLKTMLYLFLERVTAPITTSLIALTEGEKRESLERGVGNASQWRVAHSGVEPLVCDFVSARAAVRERFGISDDTIVAGTVARLEPVKGVRCLVEAAAHLKERNIGFLIVGDGGERADLETLARKLGVERNVMFAGMRDDVSDMLAAMDIFIQPSLNEGMGKTIIQAQAMGLPVVGTRVQGIPDALRENFTGLLVRPGDPKAIADVIAVFANDPELRRRMGRFAAQWVMEPVDGYPRFSGERMVHLLEKIYEESR